MLPGAKVLLPLVEPVETCVSLVLRAVIIAAPAAFLSCPPIFSSCFYICCCRALKTHFCVPTDELLREKDDLLSEGGQSLSSLTEQVVRQSLQPNRHSFSLLPLTKAYVCCNLYFLLVSRSVPATAW